MAPLIRPSNIPPDGENSRSSNTQIPPSRLHEVEIIEIEDDDENGNASEEEADDEGEDGDGDEDSQEEEEDDSEEDVEEYGEEYEDEVNGTDSLEDHSTEFEQSEQDGLTVSPDLLASTDLQQVLHPLRHTAERVSHQIEAFAQNLDRFKRQGCRPNDPDAFREACKLLKRYQLIVGDTAKELSKSNSLRKSKQPGSGNNRGSGSELQGHYGGGKLAEEIKRWQLEAETWELLYEVLSVDDPDSRSRAKRAQETVLQSLHRYSSDREVWERFLEVDHFALQCVTTLKWLERTARSTTQDIDILISELETKAERGHGLWAHGWLYTKEAIKGAKRLRSWPQPLEPDDPGIAVSLLSSEKREPLITQLDPDAVTRQQHGLQKQDQFYEQATWLTLWKMLRQGDSWTRIREWSQERLESWRAVSVCASSMDLSPHGSDASDDGLTRMMNCRSQESWRSACSVLANSSNTGAFERAVYALLCGETEPAYRVCQSWGDYLYVFYNHLILIRYREFCKQFQRKMSYAPSSNVTVALESPAYDSLRNFLDSVKKNDRTGVEARNPYRTIQSAIMSKSYDSFFFHQANAVSKVAAMNRSKLVPTTTAADIDDVNFIVAQEKDSLRIVTHLFLILQSLGYIRSDSQFLETASVNVIGYIDQLQRSAAIKFIPLYASLLPADMTHGVLGKVLIDVVGAEDRTKHVTLMKHLNIDIAAVLASQWQWVLSEAISKEDTATPIRLKRSVIKQTHGPGRIVPVKKDLIGRHIAAEDEHLIRSLDWHRYADGQWPRICTLGTYLYKRFFTAGRLAAARELCTQAKLSTLSVDTLGYDLTEPPPIEADGANEGFGEPSSPRNAEPGKSPVRSAEQRRSSSGSRTRPLHETLYLQSQTMRDLEQLILAFDALETWAQRLDQYEHLSDPQQVKAFKKTLQESLDNITENVEPLCGDWLIHPKDDTEATELEFIRTTYLPEVILAYHSALYFAGHAIGREILVQCMTLATVVAGSSALTDSFMASGRMAELVDAFALSSIAIMNAKEPKMKKKLPQGASLDIWKIKPQEEADSGS